MAFFPVAFGLALHALFWGAGLAILAMPKSWRKGWPAFCAPAGLALQSAVVWIGTHTAAAGTDGYARWSELIPLLLLAGVLKHRGPRQVLRELSRWWGVGILMVACLCALAFPMAMASADLTTESLGSCDAADYAAGARVFQEFARGDRGGFLGLTEVVKVGSADNFFDFWLRLNHFTPSALIALNDSVFGLATYQVTGVLTAVILALSLPIVFWLARAGMRYPSNVSLWIAGIYGLSPITWYAIAHVATAQLLAAQAIAIVTWAGIALWRGPLTARRGMAMGGILFIAYWLILGSYNFIVLVCLVPAVAFAGGWSLRERKWKRLGLWFVAMLAPLAVCSAVFAGRVSGLVERFSLFQKFDFGWKIPVLSPDGWLGAVAGTSLDGLSFLLRPLLSILAVGLLVIALAGAVRRRPSLTWLGMSLVLPILAGYFFLQIRGSLAGTNASYDAYKLFAAFYPGILCGLCFWTVLLRKKGSMGRTGALAAILLVSAANIANAGQFIAAMMRPPLIVGPDLVQLQKIEAMPDVASLNMRIPDMWARLWANSFLLRKPQYFATHTYEGRLNTPLRGEWDLNGGIIQLALPGGASRRIDEEFSLADTRSPSFIRVEEGAGWFELERLARGSVKRWRWTNSSTFGVELRFENPQNRSLRARVVFKDVRGFRGTGAMLVDFGGEIIAETGVFDGWKAIPVPEFGLPQGISKLKMNSNLVRNIDPPFIGDERQLGFQVSGIEVEVR